MRFIVAACVVCAKIVFKAIKNILASGWGVNLGFCACRQGKSYLNLPSNSSMLLYGWGVPLKKVCLVILLKKGDYAQLAVSKACWLAFTAYSPNIGDSMLLKDT